MPFSQFFCALVDGENEELDSDDDSSLDDYGSDDSQNDTANLMPKPENTRSSKKTTVSKKTTIVVTKTQHAKQESKGILPAYYKT